MTVLHFDLNFPRGMQPFLITLQDDLLSPFVPQPRAPGEKSNESNNNKKPEAEDKEGDSSPMTRQPIATKASRKTKRRKFGSTWRA